MKWIITAFKMVRDLETFSRLDFKMLQFCLLKTVYQTLDECLNNAQNLRMAEGRQFSTLN